ncbi:hypothetical protein [uncultured Anaerofustis sp.]|uniref:hypothetical protein n=1 Tax=uncultured Anaerofustis sp. TaxID=904996 RepID=UPI0025CED4D0|nr:hypothetical protein [uncultured Anaerofustis sp.]
MSKNNYYFKNKKQVKQDNLYDSSINEITNENIASLKDSLIRTLSKLEMDVLSLNKTDLNMVMRTYDNLNKLKGELNYVKKFVPLNDFIINHIEMHITKYEYYLKQRAKI